MGTTNKYDDMSALDALKRAKEHFLVLPDIQREYVWEAYEVERLFESIVDGYPVGSCILWKTTRSIINKDKPNLYYFLREYKQGESKNEKAPEVLSDEGDYYIVLDGQQRITSLNIALFGSYTSFKGGSGNPRNNPNSWITRELYYNLDFYRTTEDEDDENPKKRFCFLTTDEASHGNWYKIKELLAFNSVEDYWDELIQNEYEKSARKDLSALFRRLHSNSGDGLIHYYCIEENDYDEALDIFVRVNSTGHKLAKSDLLFSTLIDGWADGKQSIENLLAAMNSKGDRFNFTKDYLMRLALVLVDADTNLKIQSLTQKTISNIRSNWNRINSALDTMSSLLADIGLSHETITSYNATMPIAYYLYKGGKIKTSYQKTEVRKFLSIAMAKRLFGVASNSALNSTRNALKAIDCTKSDFSLSLFSAVVLTGGRTFSVSIEDIDFWLDNYEKGQSTYLLLSLLYPNCKLSQVSFHQDHCHPYVGFDNKNIRTFNLPQDVVSDWQSKRNLLPNLQFLEGAENEHKNKTPLKEWISKGNSIEYLPIGVSFDFIDFGVFFEKRRILIKKKLFDIFGITYTLYEEERDNNRVKQAEDIRNTL